MIVAFKQSGAIADLMLYGIIGEDFDAESIVSKLSESTADTLNIRIHSNGGSVSDGLAIYNAIKRHPGHTVAHIDGWAVSMASIIMLAAKTTVAASNSWIMIHNPHKVSVGDAKRLSQDSQLLNAMADQMVDIYHEKTKLPKAKIKQMMDDETWMTAQSALAFGFIDQISENEMAAAAVLPQYTPKGVQKMDEKTEQNVMDHIDVRAALEERDLRIVAAEDVAKSLSGKIQALALENEAYIAKISALTARAETAETAASEAQNRVAGLLAGIGTATNTQPQKFASATAAIDAFMASGMDYESALDKLIAEHRKLYDQWIDHATEFNPHR